MCCVKTYIFKQNLTYRHLSIEMQNLGQLEPQLVAMTERDLQNGVQIGEVPSLQHQKSIAALHRRQNCVLPPAFEGIHKKGKLQILCFFSKVFQFFPGPYSSRMTQIFRSVCTVREWIRIHIHQLPTAYVWDWREISWAVRKTIVLDPFIPKETWNTGLTMAAPRSSFCPGNKVRKQLWTWLRRVLMFPAVRQMGTVALGHEYAYNKQCDYTESDYP